MSARYCSACGAKADYGARFCSACGKRLDGDTGSIFDRMTDAVKDVYHPNYTDHQTYDIASEELSRIQIKSVVNKIHISLSNDDHIHIAWQDSKLRHTNIVHQGETLYIEEENVVAIMEIFGLIELRQNNDVYIRIPRKFKGTLHIDNTNETVSLDNVEIDGSLEIESVTGAIHLNCCRFNSGILRGKNSKISATSVNPLSHLSCITQTGQIDLSLTGSREEYTIDAQTNHGMINRHSSRHDAPETRVTEGSGIIRVLLTTTTGCIDYHFNDRY
ncbi:MAG: zinc ribbon domain-containing protein [Lachnospiraceae bacterium]|nr:zinc ribbon domain-containing protein [Lachnospiraceae bacterium]